MTRTMKSRELPFLAVLLITLTACLAQDEKTDIGCPEVACRCPFGTYWTTDSKGCTTCSCLPQNCSVDCLNLNCHNGRIVAPDGCPTCSCQPVECRPANCPINECDNGFAKDKRGCIICQCNQCPLLICPNMMCPQHFIYEVDQNGCKVNCTCLGLECPVHDCLPDTYCPNGFAMDANGCITCKCQLTDCPVLTCQACPNGFLSDSNGCLTCQCKL
nr:antistasin-like [Biomphalaria glabrata]